MDYSKEDYERDYQSIRLMKLRLNQSQLDSLPEEFRNIPRSYDISYDEYIDYITHAKSIINFRSEKYTIHAFISRYYTFKIENNKPVICEYGVCIDTSSGKEDYQLKRIYEGETHRLNMSNTEVGMYVTFIDLQTGNKIDLSDW